MGAWFIYLDYPLYSSSLFKTEACGGRKRSHSACITELTYAPSVSHRSKVGLRSIPPQDIHY